MFARRPSGEEITGLTQDLALLVKGGVTLGEAFEVLAATAPRRALAELATELHRGIADGRSFAETLAARPDIFPPIYVKMVEVAEASGKLAEVLEAIVLQRRRGDRLRRRISSALAYPTFLLVAATGVLVFVLTTIIPEFERALLGYESQIKGSTATVFALSRFLRANSDWLGAAALAAIVAGFLAVRSRRFLPAAIDAIGRIPGIRQVVVHERTVFFCATLGTLIGNAVDISTALRLIADMMRDRRSREKVAAMTVEVRQGHRLSEALAAADLLPPYVFHMLRVGEEAGELPAVALRVAGFYEEKLDQALTRMTSVLGPTIMAAVGGLIAWLIISVVTALLSVNDLLV
jgi:general secretion pathway protein F